MLIDTGRQVRAIGIPRRALSPRDPLESVSVHEDPRRFQDDREIAPDALRGRHGCHPPAMQGTRHPWLSRLLERRAPKVAALALANKTARIVWAMMMNGERYRQPPVTAA